MNDLPRRVDADSDASQRLGLLYETYIALRLEALGYRVQRTPMTSDGGADLLAFADGITAPLLVVQCKAWADPVGVAAVQETYAAKALNDAAAAVLVVSSSLTKDAASMADRLGILSASMPITGSGVLPVPNADELKRNVVGPCVPLDKASNAAHLAALDRMRVPPSLRDRWAWTVERSSLERQAGTAPVWQIYGSLKRTIFTGAIDTILVFCLVDAMSCGVRKVDWERETRPH